MIDVQIYIDRLEELKHKIACKIDGYIWIDYNTIPKMNPQKIIEFFNQTGWLFYNNEKN